MYSLVPTLLECAPYLEHGKVGVVPTDTVYGLVAKASKRESVERIYTIKGRDSGKPFIILIASLDDLAQFGIVINEMTEKVLGALWPGPNSIILPCTSPEFSYLHRDTNSLAFRMPDQVGLTALVRATGPLVAPSANPQGQSPANTAQEAIAYFNDSVDFYFDGGKRDSSPSSIFILNEKAALTQIR